MYVQSPHPGLGSFLDDLAASITRMEGACSSAGVCTNNNPGNLRAGVGQTGTDSRGFAIFPDYQTGYNALLNQEQLNIDKGLTLSQFFGGEPGVYAGYAPAADSNQPNVYTSNVASWLGIPSDVPLADLQSPGTTDTLNLTAAGTGAPSIFGGDLTDSLSLTNPDGSISTVALAGLAALGIGLVLAIA